MDEEHAARLSDKPMVRLLVTAPPGVRVEWEVANTIVVRPMKTGATDGRHTWEVVCLREHGQSILTHAIEAGWTVEELIDVDHQREPRLLTGEPGSGWKKKKKGWLSRLIGRG